MNRRDLLKQGIGIAAMEAMVRNVPGQSPPITERSYDSATISVRLVEEQPGTTSVLLIEHGNADYVAVEAFYWATMNSQSGQPLRVMLHKETTAPLAKDITVATALTMPLSSIVFVRVREMKLVNQFEFGKEVPHGS